MAKWRSFNHWNIYSIKIFIRQNLLPRILKEIQHSITRSLNHSITQSLNHSITYLFVHLFTLFIHSSIHPFIHSSIHSFVHSIFQVTTSTYGLTASRWKYISVVHSTIMCVCTIGVIGLVNCWLNCVAISNQNNCDSNPLVTICWLSSNRMQWYRCQVFYCIISQVIHYIFNVYNSMTDSMSYFNDRRRLCTFASPLISLTDKML